MQLLPDTLFLVGITLQAMEPTNLLLQSYVKKRKSLLIKVRTELYLFIYLLLFSTKSSSQFFRKKINILTARKGKPAIFFFSHFYLIKNEMTDQLILLASELNLYFKIFSRGKIVTE